MEDKLPTAWAVETRFNYEVICPLCGCKHRHGKMEGVRTAHCVYNRGSYYVKLKNGGAT